MAKSNGRLAFAIFILASVAIIFSAGLLAARLDLLPYRILNKAFREVSRQLEYPDRLLPVVHEKSGVRIHDASRVAAGSTFITSYFPEIDWKAGAQLIDPQGNLLHQWEIDPDGLFPGVYIHQNYIHGSYLFPNGDILFNLEFVGLARVSSCGEVIWTYDDLKTHHSISRAADGNFWVSGNKQRENGPSDPEFFEKYSFLDESVAEDYFVKISPDGEVLNKISSVEVFVENGMEDVILRGRRFGGDIFHLNDIEELSPEAAENYPGLAAGDLVVSFRDLHTILVVDPATLEIKWIKTGSTIYQHDPDFIGDGWIGTFDNNLDRTARGSVRGGSRIIAFNPETGAEKILFPTELSDTFYTSWSGKWQQLSNGNMLLTEARAGRALEVAPTGESVWEWVHARYDEKRTAEVMEATRYDISAEDVAKWTCE